VTEDPTGLVLQDAQPGAPGPNTLTLHGATPGKVVGIVAGLRPGTSLLSLGACGSLAIELAEPWVLLGRVIPDAGGDATLSFQVPAWLVDRPVGFQAVQPASCAVSNFVVQVFH